MEDVAEILSVVTLSFKQAPYDINNGACEDWAGDVFGRLQDTHHRVEVWASDFYLSDATHIFVRIDGKFYDAECLDGAVDHNDLPIFERAGGSQPVFLEGSNYQNPEEIKRDWPEGERCPCLG